MFQRSFDCKVFKRLKFIIHLKLLQKFIHMQIAANCFIIPGTLLIILRFVVLLLRKFDRVGFISQIHFQHSCDFLFFNKNFLLFSKETFKLLFSSFWFSLKCVLDTFFLVTLFPCQSRNQFQKQLIVEREFYVHLLSVFCACTCWVKQHQINFKKLIDKSWTLLFIALKLDFK